MNGLDPKNIRSDVWRPIKTAPLREYVLVGTARGGHRVVTAMQFKDDRGRKGWNHTGARWTHWMPIPAGPTTSEAQV